MTLPTFAEFAVQARAQGFDEVLERPWAPGTVLATHSHPFDASALVVQGTLWLTEGGHTRKLGPGDRFELARDCRTTSATAPRAPRIGWRGATGEAWLNHPRAEDLPQLASPTRRRCGDNRPSPTLRTARHRPCSPTSPLFFCIGR